MSRATGDANVPHSLESVRRMSLARALSAWSAGADTVIQRDRAARVEGVGLSDEIRRVVELSIQLSTDLEHIHKQQDVADKQVNTMYPTALIALADSALETLAAMTDQVDSMRNTWVQWNEGIRAHRQQQESTAKRRFDPVLTPNQQQAIEEGRLTVQDLWDDPEVFPNGHDTRPIPRSTGSASQDGINAALSGLLGRKTEI